MDQRALRRIQCDEADNESEDTRQDVDDVCDRHERMSYARIAIAGSIPAARRAGIQHAKIPIAAIITATAMKVAGSSGATSKSNPRITRVAKNAPTRPTTRPMASNTPPSRRIRLSTR